jgi:hypothetical protein
MPGPDLNLARPEGFSILPSVSVRLGAADISA